MPETGGFGIPDFAGVGEEGFVLPGGKNLALQVFGKLGFENGVRKLFQQNRRKIQITVECNSVPFQIPKHPKQGKVRFSRCFMQPFHAVRPRPVVHDIGEVGVQSERQEARWMGGGYAQERSLPGCNTEFPRAISAGRRNVRGAVYNSF